MEDKDKIYPDAVYELDEEKERAATIAEHFPPITEDMPTKEADRLKKAIERYIRTGKLA